MVMQPVRQPGCAPCEEEALQQQPCDNESASGGKPEWSARQSMQSGDKGMVRIRTPQLAEVYCGKSGMKHAAGARKRK